MKRKREDITLCHAASAPVHNTFNIYRNNDRESFSEVHTQAAKVPKAVMAKFSVRLKSDEEEKCTAKWECNKCGKRFKRKHHMTCHEKTVHGPGDEKDCEICGYRTRRSDRYLKHVRVQHKEKYNKMLRERRLRKRRRDGGLDKRMTGSKMVGEEEEKKPEPDDAVNVNMDANVNLNEDQSGFESDESFWDKMDWLEKKDEEERGAKCTQNILNANVNVTGDESGFESDDSFWENTDWLEKNDGVEREAKCTQNILNANVNVAGDDICFESDDSFKEKTDKLEKKNEEEEPKRTQNDLDANTSNGRVGEMRFLPIESCLEDWFEWRYGRNQDIFDPLWTGTICTDWP